MHHCPQHAALTGRPRGLARLRPPRLPSLGGGVDGARILSHTEQLRSQLLARERVQLLLVPLRLRGLLPAPLTGRHYTHGKLARYSLVPRGMAWERDYPCATPQFVVAIARLGLASLASQAISRAEVGGAK